MTGNSIDDVTGGIDMAGTTLTQDEIQKAIDFHGHWCPGLATGLRVAEYARAKLGHNSDEEIVAVAETDMCGVDGIQVITGCTVGKGNLIVKNIGKVAFSFYRRSDGKSFRVVAKLGPARKDPEEYRDLQAKSNAGTMTEADRQRFHEIRLERCSQIMEADFETLYEIGTPRDHVPAHAPMVESVICSACGEKVMETKAGLFHGKPLCIPCFQELVPR